VLDGPELSRLEIESCRNEDAGYPKKGLVALVEDKMQKAGSDM